MVGKGRPLDESSTNHNGEELEAARSRSREDAMYSVVICV
jgi:hypothetical protein